MGEMARLKAEIELYAKRNEVLRGREELRQRLESTELCVRSSTPNVWPLQARCRWFRKFW